MNEFSYLTSNIVIADTETSRAIAQAHRAAHHRTSNTDANSLTEALAEYGLTGTADQGRLWDLTMDGNWRALSGDDAYALRDLLAALGPAVTATAEGDIPWVEMSDDDAGESFRWVFTGGVVAELPPVITFGDPAEALVAAYLERVRSLCLSDPARVASTFEQYYGPRGDAVELMVWAGQVAEREVRDVVAHGGGESLLLLSAPAPAQTAG